MPMDVAETKMRDELASSLVVLKNDFARYNEKIAQGVASLATDPT